MGRMSDPVVTLTTDFGEASPFASAMKGVILSINPAARIVDLSHAIPPQDVRHAAFFLAQTVPYFPPGVIHVVVVDPGVGTERRLLYVEADGHRLLAPDNGACHLLLERSRARRLIRLAEARFWRPHVSHTFHGRDILAPVAGHLSLGLDPLQLGPRVEEWVPLDWPQPKCEGDRIIGEVVFVDQFGNLMTNIGTDGLPAEGPAKVKVEGHPAERWVRAYGEAAPGQLVALVSSSGFVEVAVVQGNAARRLDVGRGAAVHVWLREWLA